MSAQAVPSPFFLQGVSGSLFAVHFTPTGAAARSGEAVLLLPPFAEELNKTRPMLASQARALASLGLEVLLVDLYGTGDSEGDFADARWDTWLEDLAVAADWLQRSGAHTVHLWGVRGGALLLGDLRQRHALGASIILLWQPVLSGKQLVTQLVRMRHVTEVERPSGRSMEDLRRELRETGRLEVAGYELPFTLTAALETRSLEQSLAGTTSQIIWLDVAPSANEPLPASARVIATLRGGGKSIDYECVTGDPFWGTPEIARVPALLTATSRMLAAARAASSR